MIDCPAPPAAVEAAARAIDPASFDPNVTLHDPFGHEEPEMRAGRQSAARATAIRVLSAAAPPIAQQTLEALAQELHDWAAGQTLAGAHFARLWETRITARAATYIPKAT